MIITIGGLPGTGTTTMSKLISERYNLKHVCAGFIFRDMAKEMNMELQEFSKYAEENPEIDKEIDRKQVEMAKEGNIVLEGRLAAWMLKNNNVNPTLSIWLRAPPMVRCERISERENEDLDTALTKMINRENSEKSYAVMRLIAFIVYLDFMFTYITRSSSCDYGRYDVK